MKFSERLGINQPLKDTQLDSMDMELRNGLWNVLYQYCTGFLPYSSGTLNEYFEELYHSLFKRRVDEIPYSGDKKIATLRSWFLGAEWYEVYDLMDFTSRFFSKYQHRVQIEKFREDVDVVLKREFAGFRFLGENLSPITNSSEVEEIEEALNVRMYTSLRGANVHLESAVRKLSDRQQPDYRNSIKESISAVETVAKQIAGVQNESLGPALTKLKSTISLPAVLESSYKKLYGYTSSEDGIRHSLMDESNLDFEDAKYMLVICSAFINYLVIKSKKAGIPL